MSLPSHINKHCGSTLLELLVVLVIIGLLAGIVGPRLFENVGKPLTVSNAIEHFGLGVEGWTITLKSPALSYYSAARVIEGAGATMKWDQPWFDISNTYGPSLNPLKWASGFLDILCGACVHSGNNQSEGVP